VRLTSTAGIEGAAIELDQVPVDGGDLRFELTNVGVVQVDGLGAQNLLLSSW
jgi:hypothetical protein